MYKFYSKVVLVTGSTKGLGQQIAKDFAKLGAQVIVTGRNLDAINSVVEECNSLSPCDLKAIGFPADVTNVDEIKSLVGNVIENCGKLDILINNAGAGMFGSIEDDDILEKFDKMIKLNLFSVIAFTQAALPHLKDTQGCIVNITSIVASKQFPMFLPYDTSKTALLKFSKNCAIILGPKGIRVNTVSPTAVHTGFQDALNGENSSEVFDAYVAEVEGRIPLRRIATPEDVSNAVLYLSSDSASFITGQDILVDGGHSYI